jgi:hypothetical protein
MNDDEQKARDVARETAWKHFDLHAKQRIEVFKSYLTLSAVIFAGYGVTFQVKLYGIGIALALFSILISVLFWFLDQRTRDLVKLSETYLKGEEKRLADTLHDESIKLFAESDRLSDVRKIIGIKISYGRIFSIFFVINIALAAFLVSVFIIKCFASQQA